MDTIHTCTQLHTLPTHTLHTRTHTHTHTAHTHTHTLHTHTAHTPYTLTHTHIHTHTHSTTAPIWFMITLMPWLHVFGAGQLLMQHDSSV